MIMGFIGARGSGKTLSMVLEAYRYHEQGYTILSNLGLSFPHQTYDGKTIESYASDKNPLKNAVILVDEAHVLLDSRSSQTKRNRIVSYFILQTRKRNVHLLYTTQSFHQVEKRLRDQSDYVIECSFDKLSERVMQRINDRATGRTIKGVFDAKPVYDLYDTNLIIDPFAE
jgi:hypothetical protein